MKTMNQLGGIGLAALLVGCGGGGGAVLDTSNFSCTGVSPAQPDRVAIDCPASASVMLLVDVLIDGPTTSGDIFGIKFDLVFDETVLGFRPPVVEGAFLDKDGQPTILQADLQAGDSGRLVVALSRQSQGGNPGGVQATGARELVLTVGFSGTQPGISSIAFENAEVVDSNLNPIGSIQFQGPVTVEVR